MNTDKMHEECGVFGVFANEQVDTFSLMQFGLIALQHRGQEACGISFLTNKMVKVAGYVLAVLLIIFILTIHLPNYLNAGDKEMKLLALVNLLKDTAIAGFALHVAAGAHHQHFHLENSD